MTVLLLALIFYIGIGLKTICYDRDPWDRHPFNDESEIR